MGDGGLEFTPTDPWFCCPLTCRLAQLALTSGRLSKSATIRASWTPTWWYPQP